LGVDTSKDLKYARIKISIIPFSQSEMVLGILKKQLPKLQRILNQKITIKFVPQIRFALDKTEEKASRIEEILRKINK
jgi:ribosome-binding factor A